MTASMADKPFALISLAQGAVHSAGSDQVLQSHSLFSINSYRFLSE